ncbi:septum formation inhibitor Maf [Maribacter sp. 2304DJ31-5]|uniref:septum formation inhibitor Maf n=1 Tax=Maribacter sp. 2304DJ31-5 TaxID=3386273 RepID=UPI0039BCE882
MFKKWLKLGFSIVASIAIGTLIQSCKDKIIKNEKQLAMHSETDENTILKNELSQEFKEYWYAGKAEITSYELEQARYGELRKGNAVLIYVTEPFLFGKQVKADNHHADNVPVLKLNSTKNYLTGIYPYSIMSSSFYPVHDQQHAVKVAFSSQEWCGQVYAQINNRDNFKIQSHSYFENEADQNFSLDKTHLENEIWNKIRINPANLPVGQIEMIPSLEYIRLSHKKLRAYKAIASITVQGEVKTYEIIYPDLNRSLKINFTKTFPYTIESWTETFKSGYGPNAQVLASKGIKKKSLNTPYWQQNSNKYLYLRDSLGL